jgi:glycosyltransferase involved in cell wall biosynthesis
MEDKRDHILVMTFWGYKDALIQTYTLPYLRIIEKLIPPGSSIHLLTLDPPGTDSEMPPPSGKINRISARYYRFGWKALLTWAGLLIRLLLYIRKNKINTIHCWCPTAGAGGYVLSRLTGIRLILDSFEPHAEAMVENGSWKKNSLAFKLLWNLEGKQARHAAFVIAAAHGMKEYMKEKYKATPEHFFVKPACVDMQLFSLNKKKNPVLLKTLNLENKTVCVYAGKFGGIYLKEEVFHFFREAYAFWGENFRVLLLTVHPIAEIRELADKYALPESLFVIRFVAHQDIPDYLGLADFALSPIKSLPSKRLCTPIKTGEYWAMGLPVLTTPHISEDSDIIEHNKIGYVWQDYSAVEFEKSLIVISNILSEEPVLLSTKIRNIAELYRSFRIAETVYKTIYERDIAENDTSCKRNAQAQI